MRFSLPFSFFLVTTLGCGAQPGAPPAADTSDSNPDDTVSITVSALDTATDSSVDTSSSSQSITENATHEDTQNATGSTETETTETDSGTASTSEPNTDTTTTTGSGSETDTTSQTQNPTASETLSTDSETGSVDTDSPPAPCEFMSSLFPEIVCCPVVPPKDCTKQEWSFSEKSRTYGCCTKDLDSHVYCDNGAIIEEPCDQTCSASGQSLSCVDNSCEHPYAVTVYPHVVYGSFTDYSNTFTPTDPLSCGDGGGGEDVWFLLRVPPVSAVTAKEQTSTNTTLRKVQNCGVGSCIDKAENPETMTFVNDGSEPLEIWLILSEGTSFGGSSTQFEIDFRLESR